MSSYSRNKILDVLKLICCIGVVFIHCWFPKPVGSIIASTSQIAVPVFFMSSGYFFLSKDFNITFQKLKSKTKNIFLLLGEAFAVYLLLNILLKIDMQISLKSIIRLIFINDTSIIAGHLWFLPALIYCYIIGYILHGAFKNKTWLHISVIVVLIIGRLTIFRIATDYQYYNNFLFDGLLYFEVGNFVHLNQNKLMKCFSSKGLLFFAIISTILISCFYCSNIQILSEMMRIVAAITWFTFSIYDNKSNLLIDKLAEYGRKFSSVVYVYHWLFIVILGLFNVGNSVVYAWIKPILVVILSVIWAIIRLFIKNCIMNKIHNQN